MQSPAHLPCAGKRQFDTQVLADERMARIRSDPNRTMQVPRYSFECPHCDKWHLSSRPDPRHLHAVLMALGLDDTKD